MCGSYTDFECLEFYNTRVRSVVQVDGLRSKDSSITPNVTPGEWMSSRKVPV